MAYYPIDLSLQSHGLAPYRPKAPSSKPTPYPHAFGAFTSTRPAPTLDWTQRFDSKPNNSTYYLIYETYHLHRLRPSPYNKAFSCTPQYNIYHHRCQSPYNKPHDIGILRSDIDKSGGVAMINHIHHSLTTFITYPKTGLTQDLVSDPTRFGDDSAGIVIEQRDYLVRINRESCVWQPLGPSARASNNMDGTIIGMMELRNVVDGKLCATLGSEWSGGGQTKRCVMVRGEWAPGSEVRGACLTLAISFLLPFHTSRV